MNLKDQYALINMAEVARRMGVTKQAVQLWTKGRVPQGRVKEFSKLTGIPVKLLRPDL